VTGEPLPLSIVIPTIGRVEQLEACLGSLARCTRRAAEVLVVDQSGRGDVTALVDRYPATGARVVPCEGVGIARGMNLGLREARNDAILVTHDDCTVREDWIEEASALMREDGHQLLTGRVVAGGDDPLAVPSVKDDPNPYDFSGKPSNGVLWPCNMVFSRELAVALGGFDERFTTAAEDNDFSYRWLVAGNRMRYEPRLVVWHNDWRSRDELERLYVHYWREQGAFYAKHLRLGDRRMLRFIAIDAGRALRAMAARVVRGRPRWSDPRRGMMSGLPGGLREGWRRFAPGSGEQTHA
jgi:GT2 family glycosyltransferase